MCVFLDILVDKESCVVDSASVYSCLNFLFIRPWIVNLTMQCVIITRNEPEVDYPIIYTDTNLNAILFIDSPTIPKTTILIRQLRHHVSR